MVTKSKGPRPKKGRLGKKKKKLVESHTLAHLRGTHDYSHSHTRKREIDTRVAGAGILGARIRAPRHHGVTIPTVPVVPPPRAPPVRHGRQMPLRASARRSLTIMGPQGPKGRNGADGGAGPSGARGGIGPTGAHGERGATGMHGLTGGHGPRGPAGKNGSDALDGARGPRGVKGDRGKAGFGGKKGDRGMRGLKGANGYAGLDGLVGPLGPAGPQGPRGDRGIRGNIEYEFNAPGRGADTDMVVRGADVYRRQAAPEHAPPPKPAPPPKFPGPMPPKPPPGPKFGGFNAGTGPPPQAQPKPPKGRKQENKDQRQERRQERKEEKSNKKGRAKEGKGDFPKGHKYHGMTEAEAEAKHEADKLAKLHNPASKEENKMRAIKLNRELINKARANKKAADLAAKVGAVPSGSANIPDPNAAGPSHRSEHAHHHTGHRHKHDDNFATGL